jgi:hypothetical protein
VHAHVLGQAPFTWMCIRRHPPSGLVLEEVPRCWADNASLEEKSIDRRTFFLTFTSNENEVNITARALWAFSSSSYKCDTRFFLSRLSQFFKFAQGTGVYDACHGGSVHSVFDYKLKI